MTAQLTTDVASERLGSAQATAVADVESWFGDPARDDNVVSYARALTLDESQDMPAGAIDSLIRFGFRRRCVPESNGGLLSSCDQLIGITRAIARRDMTLAISESTQMWLMLVWIGGSAQQQAAVSKLAVAGEVVPCLAYSEQAHGADLVANSTHATAADGGYLLNGSKWPINRAATSTHLVVLARTADDRDASPNDLRSQSLFLVDRSSCPAGTISSKPKVPTHGLRGCDISGVVFTDVPVASADRIGLEGHGLELALKGLLVTRTFCAALSLGAGDTVLRQSVRFLSNRVLYGAPATNIPYVQDVLADAYVGLIAAECATLVASRAMHYLPDELSLWANLTKVGVSRIVEANNDALVRLIGARSYMRDDPDNLGIVQKMVRDGAVVSIFDGSEPVCLDSIAQQLGLLARFSSRHSHYDWSRLYTLDDDQPPFRPDTVAVFGGGRDAVFASLRHLHAEVTQLCAVEGSDTYGELMVAIDTLVADVAGFMSRCANPAAVSRAPASSSRSTSAAAMALAAECASLHIKIACVGVWLYNRDNLSSFFADPTWLTVVLRRPEVDRRSGGRTPAASTAAIVDGLLSQYERGDYFSIIPMPVAAAGARGVDNPHL